MPSIMSDPSSLGLLADVFTAGQEAIGFQMNSSLALGLTAVFQEAIDFRDNLDYSSIGEVAATRAIYRHEQVTNFVRKTTIPAFRACVKKEINLDIANVLVFSDIKYGVSNMFAVDMSFDNVAAAMELLVRQDGTGNATYSKKRDAVDEMASMANNLDTNSGKLTSTRFGERNSRTLSVANMIFCCNTAFLVNDYLPVEKCIPLTATELAAIMLHELGHVISTIEHAADKYVTHRRVVGHFLNTIKTDDPRETIVRMHEELVPALQQIQARNRLGDKDAEKTRARICSIAIASIEKVYQSVGENGDESSLYVAGSLMYHVLTTTLLVIGTMLAELQAMIVIYPVMEYMRTFYVDRNAAGGKSSDTKTTYSNTFLSERRADEFVSRHGMGVPLAAALEKWSTYGAYTIFGSVNSYTLRHSSAFNNYMAVMVFLFKSTRLSSIIDPVGYENQYERIVRLLQNQKAAFKNTKIAAPVLAQWLGEYEKLESMVKDNKGFLDTNVGKALTNVVKNLTSPARFVSMLADANLARDYQILHDRIDDMTNNSMYYFSAKLSSM